MSGEIKFKAHLIGFKYLKSTGTWRIELDLFEEDKHQIPIHVTNVNKIIDVRYSEWIDPLTVNTNLLDLLDDVDLQSTLGTSGREETKEMLEKRTSTDFSSIDQSSLENIIITIKDSIGGQ